MIKILILFYFDGCLKFTPLAKQQFHHYKIDTKLYYEIDFYIVSKVKCFLVSNFDLHHIHSFLTIWLGIMTTDQLACQKSIKSMTGKVTYHENLAFTYIDFTFFNSWNLLLSIGIVHGCNPNCPCYNIGKGKTHN